ncbi:MAG: VWA domain-containing protein [Deltaproteobacteria bacterium]|nr:VWA domain-containing protein [Deltaproteobacteria bacterium]
MSKHLWWVGVAATIAVLSGCAMSEMAPSYKESVPSDGETSGTTKSYHSPDGGSADAEADDGSQTDAGAADAVAEDAAAADSGQAADELRWYQLSPDDSTSMASAQLIKAGFSNYYGSNQIAIRPHEVINYYDPPAALRAPQHLATSWTLADGVFVGVDARRSEVVNGELEALDLLIHAYAPALDVAERRPWNLHLCVDVSGSMSGDKIATVRGALQLLADALRPGDKISLTTFSSNARIVFRTLEAGDNLAHIRSELCALEAQSSTNMMAGLALAYEEAQSAFDPAAVNRVILFSDGNANVGDTEIASFAGLTRINQGEGIYLSGVGVGSDYDVERMDALTDAGKGAHVFLPNLSEIGVVFSNMVRKLVEVHSDAVSIEVELPASFALQRFSGEEFSTDPDARVPNVVLAAGDDLTVLSRFVTTAPASFERDLIVTVRYRPLASAAEQVFSQRIAIADLIAAPGTLLERTRLVDAYARWAAGAEDAMDATTLGQALAAFEWQDMGLEEIACVVRAGRGVSATECTRAVTASPNRPQSCEGAPYEDPNEYGYYQGGYPYYYGCLCSSHSHPGYGLGLVSLGLLALIWLRFGGRRNRTR